MKYSIYKIQSLLNLLLQMVAQKNISPFEKKHINIKNNYFLQIAIYQ